MNQENNNQPLQEESWFRDILNSPEPTDSAETPDFSTADLDRIISEIRSEPVPVPQDATVAVDPIPVEIPVEQASAISPELAPQAIPVPTFVPAGDLLETAPAAPTPAAATEESVDDILSSTFLTNLFEEDATPVSQEDDPEQPQESDPESLSDPEPEPEPEITESPQPVKKRRPRMKKGDGLLGIPHILATFVWLFIIATIGLSLGRLIWVCATDVLAFGKPAKSAHFTIEADDSIEDIAKMLEEKGLIDYPDLFVLYMKFTKTDKLELGFHELKPMIYDYHAIKTALEPKVEAREVVEVVIPEGYTCQQIFELLEKKGVCSVKKMEDFIERLDDPDPENRTAIGEYWFLEGVELNSINCFEGYLFPDTYQFYKGHDPELVLEKMLDNFDYRFTDIMKDKIDTLNDRLAATLRSRGYSQDYINQHKFTIREVVIVASMIERETAKGSESYDIASVIYNRLTNPGNYPFLNIDATVIYGMGGAKIDPDTGKTLPLTKADLEADTPYNTYTRKGLIPGPIANPGRNSLNAALDPNDTSYYYYVFDPSIGGHRFAKNEAEHEQNKAKVNNN